MKSSEAGVSYKVIHIRFLRLSAPVKMKLDRFSGNREQVAQKVAEALAGLYGESLPEAKPSPYGGGREAGLAAFGKFSVQGYANTRNKIHGNVSRLSFYIRHGVLGLREVAESGRERNPSGDPVIVFVTNKRYGDSIDDSMVVLRLGAFIPMLKAFVKETARGRES